MKTRKLKHKKQLATAVISSKYFPESYIVTKDNKFYTVPTWMIEDPNSGWVEVIEKDYEILAQKPDDVWPALRGVILSVKRLSDEEVVNLKDHVAHKDGKHRGLVTKLTEYDGKITVSFGSTACSLKDIVKLSKPEKDYEILDNFAKGGIVRDYEILDVTLKHCNAIFKRNLLNPTDIEMIDQIISVKRLSDGEVFSMQDDVESKNDSEVKGKILRIEEKNGKIKIYFWVSFSYLEDIQKSHKHIFATEYVLQKDFEWFGKIIPKGTVYKQYESTKDKFRCFAYGNQYPHWDLTFMTILNNPEWFKLLEEKKPILTTEDRVELFEGDERHVLLKENIAHKVISGAEINWNDPYSRYIYFSTKEVAERYRFNNARLLSINEVYWNQDIINAGFYSDMLEELVKSRLK